MGKTPDFIAQSQSYNIIYRYGVNIISLLSVYSLCFPIGLDFLFIKFLLQFFLSWMSILVIYSSPISVYAFSNHVFLGLATGLRSTLISIHFSPSLHNFLHHVSKSSQSTTSDNSCDRFNSYQVYQFFPSHVFHVDATHPSNHLHLCSFKL